MGLHHREPGNAFPNGERHPPGNLKMSQGRPYALKQENEIKPPLAVTEELLQRGAQLDQAHPCQRSFIRRVEGAAQDVLQLIWRKGY